MSRGTAGALFAAVIVVVIVGIDVLFFRGHFFWERLAANVGVVLIALALYFRFVHRR